MILSHIVFYPSIIFYIIQDPTRKQNTVNIESLRELVSSVMRLKRHTRSSNIIQRLAMARSCYRSLVKMGWGQRRELGFLWPRDWSPLAKFSQQTQEPVKPSETEQSRGRARSGSEGSRPRTCSSLLPFGSNLVWALVVLHLTTAIAPPQVPSLSNKLILQVALFHVL